MTMAALAGAVFTATAASEGLGGAHPGGLHDVTSLCRIPPQLLKKRRKGEAALAPAAPPPGPMAPMRASAAAPGEPQPAGAGRGPRASLAMALAAAEAADPELAALEVRRPPARRRPRLFLLLLLVPLLSPAGEPPPRRPEQRDGGADRSPAHALPARPARLLHGRRRLQRLVLQGRAALPAVRAAALRDGDELGPHARDLPRAAAAGAPAERAGAREGGGCGFCGAGERRAAERRRACIGGGCSSRFCCCCPSFSHPCPPAVSRRGCRAPRPARLAQGGGAAAPKLLPRRLGRLRRRRRAGAGCCPGAAHDCGAPRVLPPRKVTRQRCHRAPRRAPCGCAARGERPRAVASARGRRGHRCPPIDC